MAEPTNDVWIPSPGEPCYITGLADCFELALASGDFPPFERLLVLLDDQRAILAMVPEPDPFLVAGPGHARGPAVIRPVAATLLLTHGSVEMPSTDPMEVHWFAVMRDSHARQGVELIDWIVIDVTTGNYRSLALASDGP
ncbi:MAG TPA: hypothetical protein VFF40_03195 [Acidimicrobiia bacterium]|nr:hypothetical protein [Acidimicrobiia bacterium]